MSVSRIFILFPFLTLMSAIPTPLLQNAILIPISKSRNTIISNQTCDECLCRMNSSDLALNCFPNNTCQFFNTFPRTYTIQSTPQARLYFLQGILPNASQCCMPNTSYLIDKINAANWTSISVSSPRCIVLDNYGYLVAFSVTSNNIIRLFPTNLTIVSQSPALAYSGSLWTIAYYSGAYYLGYDSLIAVLKGSDFTVIRNITASIMQGVRDMMFLHDGRTLVVTSTNNRYILFFNRTNGYSLIYEQPVTYSYPHGLTYINDSFFYVTSWGDNTIYSYSAVTNSTVWMQQLILDATPITSAPGGNHLRIDECGRYWFILGANGIRIFDNQRLLLRNLSYPMSDTLDSVITDDYVIYLSDRNLNRIFRIDPNIQCS